MATIFVGEAKEPLHVHKKYICHYSPYFDAAFNRNFAEGESQTLEFRGSGADVFGIFVN
jgi:hypothetical protein